VEASLSFPIMKCLIANRKRFNVKYIRFRGLCAQMSLLLCFLFSVLQELGAGGMRGCGIRPWLVIASCLMVIDTYSQLTMSYKLSVVHTESEDIHNILATSYSPS
jgi:hypothetical protein